MEEESAMKRDPRIRALYERVRRGSMRMVVSAALYERVRRDGMRVVLGAALMVPAAVMAVNGQFAPAAEQRDQEQTEEVRQANPVTQAWSARVVEREKELVVASFAREFDIPVSLATNIHAAAVEEKVAPRVAFGLVKAESSFRTRAVSPVGAVGLTQLLPSTARWMVPGTTRSDLMNPETNLRIGFKYLRYLIDEYDGDERLALTAYNRGPGTVNRLVSRGRNPDNGYADKVLRG